MSIFYIEGITKIINNTNFSFNNLNSKIMKRKLLLLFVAFVFVLSSCSDYKKVDLNDAKVKFEMKRQSTISPSGTEIIYTLSGLSINSKVIKLKNDTNVISPNSKQNIETESIGDIKIKIYQGKDLRSFDVVLWMTEEQISKMK